MKSWKKFNSKDFTKEYLQDKINTLIINEKISSKKQEFALLLNNGWPKRDRFTKFLNSPVNDISPVSSPVSNLTYFLLDSKSTTFNPKTIIPGFTIASPGKDTNNYLKKSSTINVDLYIHSASEES